MKKLLTKTGIALTALMMLATTAVAQTVNMDRYITLTVLEGVPIHLTLACDDPNTSVKLVSGTQDTTITVGTSSTDFDNFFTGATTVRIYGNVKWFDCRLNYTYITGLDASRNTGLTHLYCNNNSLTALNLSGLSNLKSLNCANNNTLKALDLSGLVNLSSLFCTNTSLTTLDLSGLSNLKFLNCSGNDLTTLDLSEVTKLIELKCNGNSLTALDLSKLINLEWLECYNNSLTALDLSGLSKLGKLKCYNNKFSTDALDDIYCALPKRTISTTGIIIPVLNASSSNHAIVMATNKTIATDKRWKVMYDDETNIPATTGTYECGTVHPVNMSRYITLTVQPGQQIQFNLAADVPNTGVKVVSGTQETTFAAGTDWTGFRIYYSDAGASTMKVYGNIKMFDCYGNTDKLTGININNSGLTHLKCNNNSLTDLETGGFMNLTWLECSNNSLTTLDLRGHGNLTWLDCSKNLLSNLNLSRLSKLTVLICNNNSLTDLDVSKLSNLKQLTCYNNNFSTDVLDDIYCALPARAASDDARIFPVYNASSSNHAIVMATNKANATKKNWKVQYGYGASDIPTTTGTHVCGTLHVNMSRYITLTVQKGEQIRLSFAADADNTSVKVVSGNEVTTLAVGIAGIGSDEYLAGATTMTIYGNVNKFDCDYNYTKLTGLDASNNTQLTSLRCSYNSLTTLQVSSLSHLTELYCDNNSLTALHVSGLSKLKYLECSTNSLTALDISGLRELIWLSCFNNNLSTNALDNIYCALPVKAASDNAKIRPVYNSSSSNYAIVLATNKANATSKNWTFRDIYGFDIPTTGTYVCGTAHPVNMSRYITLTVQPGEQIRLNFKADATNTGVKVVNGTQETTLKVDTDWIGFKNYLAEGTEMTIYGNVNWFDCSENTTKLTGLDASNNTGLTRLYCNNNSLTDLDVSGLSNLKYLICYNNSLKDLDVSGLSKLTQLSCFANSLTALDVSGLSNLTWLDCFNNNFSTQALDNIYCALPDRAASDEARIYPIYNNSSYHDIVLATNKANATSKKWAVLYYANDTDIPETTGTYDCSINMSRYITLTVQQGQQIRLNLVADADNTSVMVVSGTEETTLKVETGWTGFKTYLAGASTMTIYGNVKWFDCNGNTDKLTGLDASKNTELTELYCYNNSLTDLDVSGLSNLTWLECSTNSLTDLDVSGLSNLTHLSCSNNSLTALEVSGLSNLIELDCFNNNFSTQTLDDIYCALPDRTASDEAMILPVYDASSANYAIVMATNKQNAIDKGWAVQYYANGTDIPATTGTYDCVTTGIENITHSVSIYPNPTRDILNIHSDEPIESLALYDAQGRCVLSKSNLTAQSTTINVSSLDKGIYMLKLLTAGGAGMQKVAVK